MPSFENLVALANYEERLKGAKKIVWRDRGELPVEIHDLWECLKHATRGGLSEFKPPTFHRASKSYDNSFRSCHSRVCDSCGCKSDLVIDKAKTNQAVRFRALRADTRIVRVIADRSFREYRFAAIRHAMLGEDCFRFAAMLGVWSVLISLSHELKTHNKAPLCLSTSTS